jgi:hypothetical protein
MGRRITEIPAMTLPLIPGATILTLKNRKSTPKMSMQKKIISVSL